MGWKTVLLAACTVVNVYVFAASVYLALVLYPRFGSVERSAWADAYHAYAQTNGWAFVPWELLAFALTLALYAARPESAPAWGVHVAAACGLAYFVVTFGWHLPAHKVLEAQGNSPELLAPLLSTQWLRTAVQLPRVAVLVWMLVR